jgi:hypothetical protein
MPSHTHHTGTQLTKLSRFSSSASHSAPCPLAAALPPRALPPSVSVEPTLLFRTIEPPSHGPLETVGAQAADAPPPHCTASTALHSGRRVDGRGVVTIELVDTRVHLRRSELGRAVSVLVLLPVPLVALVRAVERPLPVCHRPSPFRSAYVELSSDERLTGGLDTRRSWSWSSSECRR